MAEVVLISLLVMVILPVLEGYTLSDIPFDPYGDMTVFTDSDIAKFDGSDPKLPIYMAVRGVVFDVTEGKSFYGKDSSYNALTGRDATRGVAKMSLDEADQTHDISGLSDELLESLDKIYKDVYVKKYPIVGYMKYLVDQKRSKLDL